MSTKQDWFKRRQKDWSEGYIGSKGDAAVANENYISIDVESLWISHMQKGLSKFYSAIHGSISVPHEMGENREYQVFNPAADARELDPRHPENIVYGPISIINDVPYRGNGMEVGIALLSIKSADLAAPYIELLKSVSDIAGISVLSQSVPMLNALNKGLTSIVGQDSLELGRYGNFDTIYPGYYAVIRREESDEFSMEMLEFDENKRKLMLNGKHMDDCPYFVLKIATSAHKEYWYNIPEIKNAYAQMKNQFRQTPFDFQKNLQAFYVFEQTTELSPELLRNDADRIIETVRMKFKDYLPQVFTDRYLNARSIFAENKVLENLVSVDSSRLTGKYKSSIIDTALLDTELEEITLMNV